MARAKLEAVGEAGNGADFVLAGAQPYSVAVTVHGVAPLLFHRWDCDGVEAKSNAKKGSKTKKTDDVESYVFRSDAGEIAIPGEYFRQSMIHAAKFSQDPRSPRKSAMDLAKAALVVNEELCSLGVKDWDFLDRRRVMIQRAAVTRIRPAMSTGWKAEFTVTVLVPDYIDVDLLAEFIHRAGQLVGVGDFRPTFGRFRVVNFERTAQ